MNKNTIGDNKELWTEKDWFITFFILGLSILLRCLDLGDKPYHHDEAIFGMYAFYQFDAPATNFYRYLPMLNGPLLFHLQAFIFKIFGTSDAVGRLIPAVLGSMMVLIPFYFRKSMNKQLFYFILVLVGFSPVLVYYSRFLRHEYLVVWVYLLFLYFLLIKKTPVKYFALPFLFWIHWSIKENVYVFIAIFLGFVIFEANINFIKRKLQHPDYESFKNYYLPHNSQHWSMVALGMLCGLSIFYLLYSNYGAYNDGFLDGLYRTGFSYWFNQHSIERIKGPFSIHFMMFNWYELAAFIAILAAVLVQINKFYSQNQKTIILSFTFLCILISLVFSETLLKNFIFQDVFKLKITFDLILFSIMLFLAIFHTFILLWKNQMLHAFLFYLFIAHFFSYSYLGEKVPWLVIYPLVFGLIFAAYVFHKEQVWYKICSWKINNTILASTCILLLTCGYNLFTGIRTNFFRPSNIEEFIIQVHPVPAYKEMLNHIMKTTTLKNTTNKIQVLLIDDSTWITSWYFKNMRYAVTFDRNAKALDTFDLILSKDANLPLPDYNKIEFDYSGWWVPDYSKFNILNFYSYALNHQAWSTSGLMKYYAYTRKGFYDP